MTSFNDLGLLSEITRSLSDLGYEQPTAIQIESIPILLQGKNLLAQAQTGTGKTAAFALPILSTLDITAVEPQALILAPTRELAIQLAEAFQAYAKYMEGFHVLPIYGGQDYRGQLKALKRGVHVVVGTPGRVMDHIRRGTLKFDALHTVVLDEADEMLRMGFIEDVQWILQQTPNRHTTALFSATMPDAIRAVVKEYLHDPKKVTIKSATRTIETIDQVYTVVDHKNKLEVLTRFLEVEERDGMIIFARTKIATTELAEKLEARGYTVAAMNGDMKQSEREKVIQRIKNGSLDIVVATEVAARGLDVDRISHVVNYDIPHDPESYIHRIGRTGRAGRSGKSILLVTPRERRMLSEIERVINRPITKINTPTIQQINDKKQGQMLSKILRAVEDPEINYYRQMIEGVCSESDLSPVDIAAALYCMLKPKSSDSPKDSLDNEFEEFEPNNRKTRRKRSFQSNFKNDGSNKNKRNFSSKGKGKEKGKTKFKDQDRGKFKDKVKGKFEGKDKGKVKGKFEGKDKGKVKGKFEGKFKGKDKPFKKRNKNG